MFKLLVELGYLDSILIERFVIKITNCICGNLGGKHGKIF